MAIAVQHTYINMELDNQIVLLRKKQDNTNDKAKEDGLIRIDAEAIKKEFGDAKFFEGSILPPQDQFRNCFKIFVSSYGANITLDCR